MASVAEFARGDRVIVAQSAPNSLAPASTNRTAVRAGTVVHRWGGRWQANSDYWVVRYDNGTEVVASGSMLTLSLSVCSCCLMLAVDDPGACPDHPMFGEW